MKTILIFNDNTAEARHAAVFILDMAQQLRANIVLGNTCVKDIKPLEKVPAGIIKQNIVHEPAEPDLLAYLQLLNSNQSGFTPEIFETGIAGMNESMVAELINRKDIWMMVKGAPDLGAETAAGSNLNVQSILNKVLCPLMIIPACWQIKELVRLVYIADLRYCRIQIVKYLTGLAQPLNANLLIAHLTANGLPEMADKYALSVFEEEISRKISYENVYFNNVKEKDLKRAVDVMINGMHNDLLVMVNHRFHFEEVVGRYITNNLPVYITVPLLIFPF